jgi:hypothetical protein
MLLGDGIQRVKKQNHEAAAVKRPLLRENIWLFR